MKNSRRNHFHEASLEVLTDGSELTEPAIFLTIRRHNNHSCRHGNTENENVPLRQPSTVVFYEDSSLNIEPNTGKDGDADKGTIVARYNLSGLPSLTGRLSSDQSFKLLQGGAFRAVLIPSLGSGASLGGLPALFLSLINSGYRCAQPSITSRGSDGDESAPENDNDVPHEDITSTTGGYNDVPIIGPPGVGVTIDGILDTIFGNVRRRPSIRICECPVASNWWEVYHDSYVKIWAQSVPRHSSFASECEACSVIEKTQDSSTHEESSSTSSSSEDGSDTENGDSRNVREVRNDPAASSLASSEYSIVYMVMLLTQDKEECNTTNEPRGEKNNHHTVQSQPYCFAIMPSAPCQKCRKCGTIFDSTKQNKNPAQFNTLRNLPQEIVSGRQESSFLLDFILHFNALIDEDGVDLDDGKHCNNNQTSTQSNNPLSKRRRIGPTKNDDVESRKKVMKYKIVVPAWVTKLAEHHLATSPDHHLIDYNGGVASGVHDEGILIRAEQRSQTLHKFLPFAFPLSKNQLKDHSIRLCKKQQQQMTNLHMNGEGIDTSYANTRSLNSALAFGLQSCTSVILQGWNNFRDEIKAEQPFIFVSRIKGIHDRCKDRMVGRPSSHDVDYTTNVRSLKCAFFGGSCICGECKHASNMVLRCTVDDNEIELGSSSSDCDDLQTEEGGEKSEFLNEFSEEDTTVLNDISCQDAFDLASPHLLMLGTGCATPSPLRGSSAYGLFLPTSLNDADALVLSAIIECGEGTLTGLLRHLPSLYNQKDIIHSHLTSLDVQLSHVNFIWISHSHLDHYGDLPIVVQAIANAKRKFGHGTQQQPNQLLVIAPSKVIKYLNIMLRRSNAPRNQNTEEVLDQVLYVAVTHREFQLSPFAGHLRSCVYDFTLRIRMFPGVQRQNEAKHVNYHPFASLRNVEVEHCREAFALILQMNVPSKDKRLDGTQSFNLSDFVLCFSGDTRPSARLVTGCRSYSPPLSNMHTWQQNQHHQYITPQVHLPAVSLLLHEATFLNDSQGQIDAVRKRHSTTAEALNVAHHINVEACVLTHFSQRYKHVAIKDICDGQNSRGFSWGIALDGMMVPLTKRALSGLFRLSQCVDAILTLNSEEG
ncbi:hypothetical protein ACHAXR_008510 [Thalassiosira sp. AJA248-18]